MDISEVIIIQPPLVQLNTPYPSGAYLSAFFRSQLPDSVPVVWHDLSIALFHRIFSCAGLTELFAATSARALELASEAEDHGDDDTAFNLRRYVSSAPLWTAWIDDIVDMLCTGSREKAHEFVRSAHAPRGARMERFLSELGRDVSADDERMLASLALADLADYINVVFDGNFSLIRYAESLSASTASFAEIAAAADSPVMRAFYVPLLREVLAEHTLSGADAQEGTSPLSERSAQNGPGALSRPAAIGKKLFLVTVPFAGCFAAALATCREIKAAFGDSATVCMGGGYVNTALRGTHEATLAEYVDYLSFDRGYAFYLDLLAGAAALKAADALSGDSFLRTKSSLSGDTLSKAEGATGTALSEAAAALSDDAGDALKADKASFEKEGRGALIRPAAASAFKADGVQEDLSALSRPAAGDAAIGCARAFTSGGVCDYLPDEASFGREEILTRTLVPDYRDIDFSAYPRVADDVNPMHRIWSDGAWLKAYLAHGCYWHRCAFCDTQLDYVCNYRPVGAKELHEGLARQAEEKGVYGVHFVDEAAPPAALKEFALANVTSARRRLSFWGNIRFEKAFTRDAADFLSYGGLTGVSGGIEIASGEGFTDINKGIDIDSLVGSCAAFKEAGILVHAYMIYGFYNETPQMLIDSAETLRQLFAAGLIDSAFWHKFTLTRHSTVYAEWQAGKHPELRPFKADETAVGAAGSEKAEYAEKAGVAFKAGNAEKASDACKTAGAEKAECAEKAGDAFKTAGAEKTSDASKTAGADKAQGTFKAPGAPEAQPFADYELHFAGEKKSEKYGAPLMTALDAWMHGHSLNKPVQKWFPFDMPAPKVPKDFIDRAIARYEKRRDAAFAEPLPATEDEFRRAYVWLGGKPEVLSSRDGAQLCWSYMGELVYADVPGALKADKAFVGDSAQKKAGDASKADKSSNKAAGSEKAECAEKTRDAFSSVRALAEKAAELLWSLRPDARAQKADDAAVGAAGAGKAGSAEMADEAAVEGSAEKKANAAVGATGCEKAGRAEKADDAAVENSVEKKAGAASKAAGAEKNDDAFKAARAILQQARGVGLCRI